MNMYIYRLNGPEPLVPQHLYSGLLCYRGKRDLL